MMFIFYALFPLPSLFRFNRGVKLNSVILDKVKYPSFLKTLCFAQSDTESTHSNKKSLLTLSYFFSLTFPAKAGKMSHLFPNFKAKGEASNAI